MNIQANSGIIYHVTSQSHPSYFEHFVENKHLTVN